MDWTFHVGDVVMGGMSLLLIPIARALFQMRDTLNVIAPKVLEVERQVDRHHDWLVAMRAKQGIVNGNEPR
jgi:hypothetical protein